ncbi:hypothetical protein GFL51_12100 [Rhizobium leguminosarum bv. viciae]|nr:hypothetical protein [Rhizobium leguminosarum bv. viciae]
MLVTGIQPRRVCAVNDSCPTDKQSPAPKDLGALDSCDEHRNEGEWAAVMGPRGHCRMRSMYQA